MQNTEVIMLEEEIRATSSYQSNGEFIHSDNKTRHWSIWYMLLQPHLLWCDQLVTWLMLANRYDIVSLTALLYLCYCYALTFKMITLSSNEQKTAKTVKGLSVTCQRNSRTSSEALTTSVMQRYLKLAYNSHDKMLVTPDHSGRLKEGQTVT